jgi:hypothetical protein
MREATLSPVRHDDGNRRRAQNAGRKVNSRLAGHERIDALFVQSATSFTCAGGATVTLHGLAESTVYFTDRPRREVGHMRSSSFLELWEAGADSFGVDPPNAVLSFLDGEDSPDDVVVVLHEPRLVGNALTYTVDVLEGALPENAGPCALFIDSFGRPWAPVSVPTRTTENAPA